MASRIFMIFENKDYGFKVKVLSATSNPQTIIYQALHQDYSSDWVGNQDVTLTETECGEIAVSRLLANKKGHFGCLEHPQIIFACGYINHGTVQQLRTHRFLSFDCQSMRYTSEHFIKFFEKHYENKGNYQEDIEKLIFIRSVGNYSDRQGNKFYYSEQNRRDDINLSHICLMHYHSNVVNLGQSPEFARGLLPFDYRQHFVVSGNLRSWLHVLDLRAKANAQDEIVILMDLIYQALCDWCPQILEWYTKERYKKALLAP